MSCQTELERLVAAKGSMRQSIIAKGVDVPESAKMASYPEYISQIEASSGPDPDNPTLESLKLALATDDPAAIYPVGTEIPDTYAGNNNPLIVVQYLDSSNNSPYRGAEGVILARKFVEPTSQQFGASGNYPSSTVKSLLDGAYFNNCSDAVRSTISQISVPYYNGSATVSVASKFFLMSAYEVCNQGANTVINREGTMWDFWKKKTGLSSADAMNSAQGGRVMKDRSGAPCKVWLRSRGVNSGAECFVQTSGAVSTVTPTSSYGVLPACFIAK